MTKKNQVHKIAANLLKFAVPVDELSEDPLNANTHPTKSIDAIKSSFDQFGQQTPIVVKGSTIYKGNGSFRAAKALGWTHIAAVPFDEKVAKKAKDAVRAYALVDNRSSQFAEFNPSEVEVQVDAFDGDFDLHPFDFDEIVDTLGDDGDSSPPPEKLPSGQEDKVRTVQLFFTIAQNEEFNRATHELATVFGTSNVTDTVLEAVRRARGAK